MLSVIFVILALILTFYEISTHKQEQAEETLTPAVYEHHIAFISSYSPQFYTYAEQETGLERGLFKNNINYDAFYMDSRHFGTQKDINDFYVFFKNRIKSSYPYEAVIVGDDAALEFIQAHRKELFPDTPIIFYGINNKKLAEQAGKAKNVTGYIEEEKTEDVIRTAKNILPHTKRIIGLFDDTSTGVAEQNDFYGCAGKFPEFDFVGIDTSTLTQDEFISQLEALKEGDVVIFMSCFADKDGNFYTLSERTYTIISHTDVPVLRNLNGGVGQGVLGCIYIDLDDQAERAANLTADILNGKTDIATTKVKNEALTKSIFDYNIIQKYNINPSKLSEETVFINAPEDFFDKYDIILLPGLSIIISLILFLIASVITNTLSKRTAMELRQSRDKIEESKIEMQYKAEYDDLLDIYNRRTIQERLNSTLTQESTYSVLMTDLDDFKGINEAYGNAVADDILKGFAARLKQIAKERKWVIGRFGGDEFLIMIPDVQLNETSNEVLDIVNVFSRHFPIGEETIILSVSIGISNSDGVMTPDQHITNAEVAMYEAKKRGRKCVYIYSERMKTKLREDNLIRAKLLDAFDNDGFFMLYQPQIDVNTGAVSAYEALVRMKAPGIYPGQFIPVAEQNGWIGRIGRTTTKLVVEQLAKWKEEGHELKPVSINFSSNQMSDSGYVDFLKDLLKEHDIPSKYIEIEITESLFLERTQMAESLFEKFKEMGIRLLMDDFGTGYSSLGYLTYIPVDAVKLDKSLVDNYLVDGKDTFIKDLITLIHDLDKEMIVEGVEEEWQLNRLREFGADIIQGYYFSKPISAEEAIVFKT
ncbi:MAG: bifunctional diguanylate cyclase/phosphodiesterase [Lachnospiraceae bacterium]|nr:bifunctional diguanylate cyclase/phosphodiesterase [Lachnospiraceae bacterium]